MMRIVSILLTTAVTVTALLTGATPAHATGPVQVSIIANPHPDDETMSASMFENATANYQVYVYFTLGEQTGNCTPRYTADCVNRRIASTLGFMSQMSQSFPAIPGAWDSGESTRSFPDPGNVVSRDDAGSRFTDTSAQVYRDAQGRGQIVFWNLGDGDLTQQEVTWALNTMLQNPAEFGIPNLPLHNIVGALWAPEGTYPQCHGYAHADHRAVHVALWNNRFGARYTAASTCGADSDVTRRGAASTAYWNAAFGPGGAFHTHYGWLAPGGWPNDGSGVTQYDYFNRYQPMWVRS